MTRRKVDTCIVQTQIFKNIFNMWVTESMDVVPVDMRYDYVCFKKYSETWRSFFFMSGRWLMCWFGYWSGGPLME